MSSNNLSVLYVTACGEAGVAEYVYALADRLSKQGIEVTIVGPISSRFADSILRLNNVRFIGIPLRKKPHPIWDPYCCYRLRRTMRRFKFDIVHSNSSKAGVLTAAAKPGVTHTKFVYSPHCTSASLAAITPLARLYFALERWAARRHDLLIATCRAEQVQLLQTEMSRNGNVVYIYNGVEVREELRITSESVQLGVFPRIGTAVRLVPQKGLDILIQSLERIIERFPDAKLEIAGEGPMETELRAIACERGVEDRVRFLGYIEECDAFIAGLDLFVLPSKWEALPFALLHAGVVGTPVVASEVGGIAEVINGSTGWLVKPNDAGALAEVILEALDNYKEAEKRAAKLRKRVTDYYSLDDMVRKTLNVYHREVCGQGGCQVL